MWAFGVCVDPIFAFHVGWLAAVGTHMFTEDPILPPRGMAFIKKYIFCGKPGGLSHLTLLRWVSLLCSALDLCQAPQKIDGFRSFSILATCILEFWIALQSSLCHHLIIAHGFDVGDIPYLRLDAEEGQAGLPREAPIWVTGSATVVIQRPAPPMPGGRGNVNSSCHTKPECEQFPGKALRLDDV